MNDSIKRDQDEHPVAIFIALVTFFGFWATVLYVAFHFIAKFW